MARPGGFGRSIPTRRAQPNDVAPAMPTRQRGPTVASSMLYFSGEGGNRSKFRLRQPFPAADAEPLLHVAADNINALSTTAPSIPTGPRQCDTDMEDEADKRTFSLRLGPVLHCFRAASAEQAGEWIWGFQSSITRTAGKALQALQASLWHRDARDHRPRRPHRHHRHRRQSEDETHGHPMSATGSGNGPGMSSIAGGGLPDLPEELAFPPSTDRSLSQTVVHAERRQQGFIGNAALSPPDLYRGVSQDTPLTGYHDQDGRPEFRATDTARGWGTSDQRFAGSQQRRTAYGAVAGSLPTMGGLAMPRNWADPRQQLPNLTADKKEAAPLDRRDERPGSPSSSSSSSSGSVDDRDYDGGAEDSDPFGMQVNPVASSSPSSAWEERRRERQRRRPGQRLLRRDDHESDERRVDDESDEGDSERKVALDHGAPRCRPAHPAMSAPPLRRAQTEGAAPPAVRKYVPPHMRRGGRALIGEAPPPGVCSSPASDDASSASDSRDSGRWTTPHGAGEGNALSGVWTSQGDRASLEDAHQMVHDLRSAFPEASCGWPDPVKISYFAVFDGHSGSAAAEYAAAHLHRLAVAEHGFVDEPPQALERAFHQFDQEFSVFSEGNAKARSSGTTAVSAVVHHHSRRMYVSNVGDSRVVICRRDGVPEALSEDHKPDTPAERARIQAAGGWVHISKEMGVRQVRHIDVNDRYVRSILEKRGAVLDGSQPLDTDQNRRALIPELGDGAGHAWKHIPYVCGVLQVSRALGDLCMKQPDLRSGDSVIDPKCCCTFTDDLVSCMPDTRQVDLEDGDEFVLLACDGLWDVMSSKEAVDLARHLLDEGNAPKVVSRYIVDVALKLGSTDNVTVMLVLLSTHPRWEEFSHSATGFDDDDDDE